MLNMLKKTEKGFTLLLSMIVTSAVLSVSLGVFGLVMQELQLSSVGRESQIAFYAADSGIECAFYWDTNSNGTIYTTNPSPLFCAGTSIDIDIIEDPVGIFTSDFELIFTDGSCVEVIIEKDTVASSPLILTTMTSNGYNMACDSDNSRKVERTLRAKYEYSF